jgi:hypothetical protein
MCFHPRENRAACPGKLLARAIIGHMGEISVTEFTDPGCPFAYSASPDLAVLRWRYREQLRWRIVTIGLAEDPQRYIDAGYTPTRSVIGGLEFRRRYGMPFLSVPRARVLATSRLPRDRGHPAARSDTRVRRAAGTAARLVQHPAPARRGR